jgi:glycosyltransferase involved in cell wall biosynthesis
MKILHVESGRHLYGGAQQVLYLMEGLARLGDPQLTQVLACPTQAHIAPAARPFAQVHELPMGGDLDVGLVWRLRRLMVQERPDIVHLHSRRGADTWGALAARWAGVPCILSRRVDNREPAWLVGAKYRLYDQVITISEGIRQVLLAQGVPAAQVHCVRSAVNAAPYLHPGDKAALLRQHGWPADTLLIGMVAQLIERKGHRHLLAALPAVLAQHPQVKVLLFGRGPLLQALRQAVAQQGLDASVCFMGFRDDLPALLGCLDVLAHPADMEGLGVALLQASAAQVPIVACRAGGMPEAVRDGVNGLLIPVGDVSALTQALLRLLGDAALRTRLGAAGRALVLREFSVDAMCAGNLARYRTLCPPQAKADPA